VESSGEAADTRVSLWTLFWIFFRIALTSFGGFMAMISVVQNVVVDRKKLIKHEDMLDGISLASLLPGPVAVNLVVYVGYRLRGAAGAFISGFASVLPSFVFIVVLSVAYFRWGQLPTVSKLFMGFLPAVTAIIVSAGWNMSRKSVLGWREAALATASATALLVVGGFFSTLGIILAAGVIGWIWFREKGTPAPKDNPAPASNDTPATSGARSHMFLLGALPAVNVVPLLSFDPSLVGKIFVTFAVMSMMLFGGAYVFIPLIQEIVVEGHGWVTQQEFIDAVAMGQITPGPILVSAAFVGMKVAGLAGAIAATLGIYVPSALLMIGSSKVLDRIKRSAVIKAALRGVRPAVVGMIFAAAIVVGKSAAMVWVSVAIFGVALLLLMRFRVEAVWIIPPAGILGMLLY